MPLPEEEIEDFDFEFGLRSTGDGSSTEGSDSIEFLSLFDDLNLPQKVRERISQERKRIQKVATKALTHEKYIRLRDKISFTMGVVNVALTAFFIGNAPGSFYIWHTLKAMSMLIIRWYIYRKKKWHYFLFDMCYMVNVILLLWIWVYPDPRLFRALFSMSLGPLAWAILAWRNTLVFHSLDKMTSIFIHISPPILCWCVRWHPEPFFSRENVPESYSLSADGGGGGGGWVSTLFDSGGFWDGMAFFAFWQALYAIKVYTVSAVKVREQDYMTSYNYLMKNKDHVITRFATFFREKTGLKKVWGFIVIQAIYTALTLLPVPLLYHSRFGAAAFVFLLFVAAAWNGSVYYTEVFARRYNDEVEKRKRTRRLTQDIRAAMKKE